MSTRARRWRRRESDLDVSLPPLSPTDDARPRVRSADKRLLLVLPIGVNTSRQGRDRSPRAPTAPGGPTPAPPATCWRRRRTMSAWGSTTSNQSLALKQDWYNLWINEAHASRRARPTTRPPRRPGSVLQTSASRSGDAHRSPKPSFRRRRSRAWGQRAWLLARCDDLVGDDTPGSRSAGDRRRGAEGSPSRRPGPEVKAGWSSACSPIWSSTVDKIRTRDDLFERSSGLQPSARRPANPGHPHRAPARQAGGGRRGPADRAIRSAYGAALPPLGPFTRRSSSRRVGEWRDDPEAAAHSPFTA